MRVKAPTYQSPTPSKETVVAIRDAHHDCLLPSCFNPPSALAAHYSPLPLTLYYYGTNTNSGEFTSAQTMSSIRSRQSAVNSFDGGSPLRAWRSSSSFKSDAAGLK